MTTGFHNRVLHVDLTSGAIHTESPGEEFFRTYLGGWGLVGHTLLTQVPPEADPFGPDNVLVFAPGVLTGVPVGGTGRHTVGAKSPLTGGFGAAEAGGFWGAELKRAGWDGIVIRGRSSQPAYLSLVDDVAEIRPAGHLWGRLTGDVEQAIRDELTDQHVRVAQCGPAGEKLVRYASVMHDVSRAAGRTGLGAVMGSKNLRAVAVRGHAGVPLADKESVKQVADWLVSHWSEFGQRLHDHGTLGGMALLNRLGGLPTRNFQQGVFEGAEMIGGEALTDRLLADRDSCFACPVYCKRRLKPGGRYGIDPVYGGPEFESVAALGSLCGVDDLEAVVYANQLCNAYGLDTISTGVTIAWIMECYERGLVSEKDTSGEGLRFGDASAMVALVRRIALREGLGMLLGEGTLRASRALGKGTERYALQVKGQEMAMHDPRIKFGMDIGYATSPTGADHNHNIWDHVYATENRYMQNVRSLGILNPLPVDDLSPQKMRLAMYHIDWILLLQCLGMCTHLPYSKEQIEVLVRAVTGWNSSVFELMKAGERAMALARSFNARQGITAVDDVLHWRISTPLPSGPAQGVRVPESEAQAALRCYCAMRGWDEVSGAPTEAKLDELGLTWVKQRYQPSL